MHSDSGLEQAFLCLRIMRNYLKNSETASQEIYNFGGVHSLFKAFNFEDKVIKNLATEVMSTLKINKQILQEL